MTIEVEDLIEEIRERASRPIPGRIKCFVEKYGECSAMTEPEIDNMPWHQTTRTCMKHIVYLADNHPNYRVETGEFPFELFAHIGCQIALAVRDADDVGEAVKYFLTVQRQALMATEAA